MYARELECVCVREREKLRKIERVLCDVIEGQNVCVREGEGE